MTRSLVWMEILLGLLLGISLGLGIAWWIAPNTQIDRSPSGLSALYKDEVRLLIASVYRMTGDVGRARVRLELLKDPDPIASLLEQALRLRLGEAGSVIFIVSPGSGAEDLAHLADSIKAVIHSSESTVTPPLTTGSIAPTATIVPFQLLAKEVVCDEAALETLARIQLQEPGGAPASGVEIMVTWKGGQQQLATGLKPVYGYGYADFIMIPGTRYMLQIPPRSFPITEVTSPVCEAEDGSEYPGSLLLTFQQP